MFSTTLSGAWNKYKYHFGTGQADFIIGTTANDVVYSYGGNDTVNTREGDDVVIAGSGNDRVLAGAGNDRVNAGSGNDAVYGGDGNDSIWGGSGNDYIDGGGGNDVIDGGTGADRIFAGAGNDRVTGDTTPLTGGGLRDYHGGTGYDTLKLTVDPYAYVPTKLVVDFDQGRFGFDPDDLEGVFTGFERVETTSRNDVFIGGATEATIMAGGGGDVFHDGAGDYRFYGQNGADVVHVGAGDDFYAGGGGLDTLSFAHITGHGAVVNLASAQAMRAEGGTAADEIGNNHIYSFERVMTTEQDDTVTLASRGYRSIETLGGDDVVRARLSTDSDARADIRLNGGDGMDTLDLSGELVGIQQSAQSPGTFKGLTGGARGLKAEGFEHLIGSAYDDILYLTDGLTRVESGSGNDHIGTDTSGVVDAGSGNDSVHLNTAAAVNASGGAGRDFIAFASSSDTAGVVIDLAAGLASARGADGTRIEHRIDGFEKASASRHDSVLLGDAAKNSLQGSLGDDRIEGRGGNDSLDGASGDDRISGGAGDDVIYGAEGRDVLDGGTGADRLSGGRKNDVLRGGDGADRLAGGHDSDLLSGGAGADTFVFTNFQPGDDRITDFDAGEGDVLLLQHMRAVDGRAITSVLGLDRNSDGLVDANDAFISDIGGGLLLSFEDQGIRLEGVEALDYAAFDFVA